MNVLGIWGILFDRFEICAIYKQDKIVDNFFKLHDDSLQSLIVIPILITF